MEKYYRPTADEIYSAPEITLKGEEGQFSIDPFIYRNTNLIVDLSKLDISDFRVKYLDKEDIESLGWVITKSHNDSDTWQAQFHPENEFEFFDLTYDFYDHELYIEHFAQSKLLGTPMDKNTFDSFTIFKGSIKNKSEFKKLISQLGIL